MNKTERATKPYKVALIKMMDEDSARRFYEAIFSMEKGKGITVCGEPKGVNSFDAMVIALERISNMNDIATAREEAKEALELAKGGKE